MKKYIELLCRVRDGLYDKEFTEIIISSYPLLVNEPIDEILEKMESDQGHIDGIDVLDKIRAEIMKLQTYKMFGGEDTVYVEHEDVLAIIDKYKAERTGT